MGRTLLEILHRGDEHRAGKPREEAARALDRYELARASEQTFASLSGGQQARFQILLLELSGATLLLLDEPTDNLDLHSAEALEEGLDAFEGTVLAVTHDRWFSRALRPVPGLRADGWVYEADEPVWDEGRVRRAR
jgi:ATPase subunit of ABC transporter with duplicated ATPase domains